MSTVGDFSAMSATMPVEPSHSPMGVFDRLGILLSSLCILHCLAMPFATTYFSIAGMEFFTEDLPHRMLLLALAASGLFAFLPGIRRHRDWTVAFLALLGFALVIPMRSR
jgi:MerC mercury resistance protein